VLNARAIDRFCQYLKTDDYSDRTIGSYRQRLTHFDKHVGLKACTATTVQAYIFSAHISQSVRCERYKALQKFFDWAIQTRWRPSNPMRRIKPPRAPKRRIRQPASKASIVDLIENGTRHSQLAVALASLAGLRAMECCNLKWEHIDFERNVLYVIQGKGKKDRAIPLAEELAEILLADGRPASGFVIRGRFGGAREPRSLSQSVAKEFQARGWQTSLHPCRHYFATELYKACRDILVVCELLGHTSARTAMIYVHVSGEQGREAVYSISRSLREAA
jgi:integrase/recombinase XerD